MARRGPRNPGISVFTLILSREVFSHLTGLPPPGQGSIALSIIGSHRFSQSLEIISWILMTILWTQNTMDVATYYMSNVTPMPSFPEVSIFKLNNTFLKSPYVKTFEENECKNITSKFVSYN